MQRHTIYLGLNDKETKTQQYDIITCYKMTQNTCLKYVDGLTISLNDGIFKHSNGEITIEKSLKIELIYTDELTARQIANDLKSMFNQEELLFLTEDVKIASL